MQTFSIGVLSVNQLAGRSAMFQTKNNRFLVELCVWLSPCSFPTFTLFLVYIHSLQLLIFSLRTMNTYLYRCGLMERNAWNFAIVRRSNLFNTVSSLTGGKNLHKLLSWCEKEIFFYYFRAAQDCSIFFRIVSVSVTI